jgi:hypothetical protein
MSSRHRNSPRGVLPVSKPSPSLGRITQNECDKEARDLKDQEAEIVVRINQHKRDNSDFRTTAFAHFDALSAYPNVCDGSTLLKSRIRGSGNFSWNFFER